MDAASVVENFMFNRIGRNNMFENIAKVWLEGRMGLHFDESMSDEIINDLAYTLAQVYDAGYNEG